MRSVRVFLLFGFFVVLIQSRPSQTDENNESDLEETEYESDEKTALDSIDENSELNEESHDSARRDVDQSEKILEANKISYEQRRLPERRADRSDSEVSDYKPYGSREVRNDKVEFNSYEDKQNYARRRESGRFIDNKDMTDQQEAAQHLTNRNVNYYKNNRIHNNLLSEDPLIKREDSSNVNEPGEMLFENDRQTRNELTKGKKNVINEPLELNQHYYTQMHPENKELQCKNHIGRLFVNRDRRETNIANENEISNAESDKESSDKQQNEDEETAIRRHIKKLTSDELQELLSSLSEEKRTLLKTIIDDADEINKNDVNKREIPKKTGAVEENACVESEHTDSSNIVSDISAISMNTDAAVQHAETTDTNKHSSSDNTDTSNSKSTETENKSGLNAQNDEAIQQKANNDASGTAKIEAEMAITGEQLPTKNENLKDTNIENLADLASYESSKFSDNDWLSDTKSHYSSNNEDLSQFLDDEQASLEDDPSSKIYKRDVEQQASYDSRIKSLEESFPKSENYDESDSPLIRVKRKNSDVVVKKRSAAIFPDAKVAFFPYRAENDEDNDEGNEFDDDGFYDRNPNLSSNNANDNQDNPNCKLNESPLESKEPISLGSDTDSVLSGVEGTNENLMFRSGSRNKRTSEDITDMEESNAIQARKSLSDEDKAVSDMNALTYQESDSFGPLPRNKEGESGRYKRIRRVKQSRPESAPVS